MTSTKLPGPPYEQRTEVRIYVPARKPVADIVDSKWYLTFTHHLTVTTAEAQRNVTPRRTRFRTLLFVPQSHQPPYINNTHADTYLSP